MDCYDTLGIVDDGIEWEQSKIDPQVEDPGRPLTYAQRYLGWGQPTAPPPGEPMEACLDDEPEWVQTQVKKQGPVPGYCYEIITSNQGQEFKAKVWWEVDGRKEGEQDLDPEHIAIKWFTEVRKKHKVCAMIYMPYTPPTCKEVETPPDFDPYNAHDVKVWWSTIDVEYILGYDRELSPDHYNYVPGGDNRAYKDEKILREHCAIIEDAQLDNLPGSGMPRPTEAPRYPQLSSVKPLGNHDEDLVSGLLAIASLFVFMGLKKFSAMKRPSRELQEPLMHL